MSERTVRDLYWDMIDHNLDSNYPRDTKFSQRFRNRNRPHIVFLGKDLAQRFCEEEGITIVDFPHRDGDVEVRYTIPEGMPHGDLVLSIHSHYHVGYGRAHSSLAPFFDISSELVNNS